MEYIQRKSRLTEQKMILCKTKQTHKHLANLISDRERQNTSSIRNERGAKYRYTVE